MGKFEMLRIVGAVLVAALLAACAGSGEYSGSKGKTLVITQQVWGWYKDYVTKISGVNKGIFVVGINNGVASSASYFYCPGASCMTANYSKKALDRCRSYDAQIDCILFANGTDILVNYKVEGE
jgi:hypothetical protein